MPSRLALLLWLFSHLSADWTSSSSDRALTAVRSGARLSAPIGRKLLFGSLCMRKLAIQRLAILDAAAQELRPFWHGGHRGGSLRQKIPKVRMMPAKFVP